MDSTQKMRLNWSWDSLWIQHKDEVKLELGLIMDSTQNMRSNWSLGLSLWISTQKDEVKIGVWGLSLWISTQKMDTWKEKHYLLFPYT
jgi:hypothetical protein